MTDSAVYFASLAMPGSGGGGVFHGGQVRMGGDDKRRVLDATDVVRLVGDHLALKRKGREYVGLCPFHADHTPSMCVVPHKQIYHCFACGAGGNAIDFVMNYHKMSFREALEFLADRSGIALTPFRPAHAGTRSEEDFARERSGRKELYGANQTASAFFQAILTHPEHGSSARDVIEKRGISAEMVRMFGLGAAPDRMDGLKLTLAQKKVEPGAYFDAGLLRARESGAVDYFRNRLMFPIQDQIGRVIAFGARRLNDEDEPKYLNSPDTPIFSKSRTLYGLHQATAAIRSQRVAIVTEGYMDTIACHQAGVSNAVATLGTALTSENAGMLRRLADTVVLLFDGDAAGQKAAERAVEIFFAQPVDVRIAMLSSATDAKDPDELLKRPGGRETLELVIQRAIDPLELLLSRLRVGLSGQGMAGRTRLIEDFVARLVELGFDRIDPIRRQLITRRLATMAGVDFETIAGVLRDRVSRARPRAAGFGTAEAEKSQVAPVLAGSMSAAEHVLACVLIEPSLLMALDEEQSRVIDPENLARVESKVIARTLHDLHVNEEDCSISGVLAGLEDDGAKRVATQFYVLVSASTEGKEERLREHWRERVAQAYRDLVKRETPLGAAGAVGETGVAGEEAWSLEIARMREQASTVGHDPQAMPKL